MSTQPPRAGKPVLSYTVWYRLVVGQTRNDAGTLVPVWSDERDQAVFANDPGHAQRVFLDWAQKMFGNTPVEILGVQ